MVLNFNTNIKYIRGGQNARKNQQKYTLFIEIYLIEIIKSTQVSFQSQKNPCRTVLIDIVEVWKTRITHKQLHPKDNNFRC